MWVAAVSVAVVVVVVVAANVAVWLWSCFRPSTLPLPLPGAKDDSKINVLLVVAHPDDESMFFAPTLLALANDNRAQIPEHRVKVVDDERLQDGMRALWPEEVVAYYVATHVALCSAKLLLTFDGRGVSGHPNHVSTYRGVLQYAQASEHRTIWVLESTGLVRKYAGLLDSLQSFVDCRQDRTALKVFIASPSCWRGVRAMMQHRSQWVWFRKLFVGVARYTYMNTLVVIRTSNN
eukprot:jgi/Chlat1/7142/Chrsp57S06807